MLELYPKKVLESLYTLGTFYESSNKKVCLFFLSKITFDKILTETQPKKFFFFGWVSVRILFQKIVHKSTLMSACFHDSEKLIYTSYIEFLRKTKFTNHQILV